jgi:putative transposase
VFWARGYFVSTVGLDEQMVRAYIRNQEELDKRYDQMKLQMQAAAFRRLTV